MYILYYLLAILVYWIPSALVSGILKAIFLKFLNSKKTIAFLSDFFSTIICTILIIYGYKLLKFDYNIYILFGLLLVFSIWTIYNPSAKKSYDQTNQAVIEASIIAFYKDYLLRNGIKNKEIDLSTEHLKIQAGDELRKEALEYADRNALELLEEQGEYQPHPQFYGVLIALITMLIFFYFQKQQQEISELKQEINVSSPNSFQSSYDNPYSKGYDASYDEKINDKVLNSEEEIENLKDDLESTKSELEDTKSELEKNNNN